jgi:hypothetical protein
VCGEREENIHQKKIKNSQKLKIYPELTKKKSKTNPRSSRFKRKKSKKKKKNQNQYPETA